MKHVSRSSTMVLAFAASLAATGAEPDLFAVPGKAGKSGVMLKDPLIDNAVRETVAESRGKDKDARPAAGVFTAPLRGDKYDEFGRQFSEAQKPSCVGPDALKHQPTSVTVGGWVIGVSGLLALPFWGAAIVRGKCN